MRATVRIGMVNFINTEPFYRVWRERPLPPGWRVVEDVPSRLNRLLADGDLDLAIASSHEYALHPRLYRLLPGLSISSNGAVGSVFLFSDRPPAALDGCEVALSPQSQTSNHLVRIVLEDLYHVRPCYVAERRPSAAAVVSIGDEALRWHEERAFAHAVDLGHAWMELTGLPFVFAAWLVRREFWQRAAPEVERIQRRLLQCVAEGRQRLAAISAEVAGRIPMHPNRCQQYLAGLQYDLDGAKQRSLALFYEKLVQRGEADPHCLPIAWCG